MEGAFGRYLSSPLFTFTVGVNKKEVIMHSSALAGLSQSLNALMTGEMIEAKTRHVDWSEVDVTETLKEKKKRKKRRSNVNWGEPAPEPAPEPELEAPPDGAPKSDSPPEDTFCDDPEIPYRERSVWTGHLRDAFEGSLVVPSPQSGDLDYTFTPPENIGFWEDFTPVFLEQARLYVLPDKYGIESLCQLDLSKLHQTLKSFKLYDTGVSGIIYSDTPTYGSKIDAMRNFATRHVVSVLGQIGGNECFQELLDEGGRFVYDFWQIIWGVEGKL
ncbi:hypothetical protein ETB97_003990 [Aspergillus alliaceus]|uniref:BTB domain-containing protein n=1 Tax=Petromyces alliaceus TaxID=209559 RepID=A0A8H6A0F1_PETAA|nr:hypothetical protein ETB97_003990 [Aspergillus burnettii]